MTSRSSAATAPAALTAAQIARRLGDFVRVTVTYTEESDPNSLLGRPGQYTSKVAFTDSRIKRTTVTDTSRGSVELGGSVEVFDTPEDAQARADYIVKVTKGVAALAEYDYVSGSTLLRLSNRLTPRQVKPLVAALEDATDSTAVLAK